MAPAAGEGGAQNVAQVQRLIIRNGSIDLVVDDVDGAIGRVTDIATRAGGYVAGASAYDDSGRRRANLSLRVPSDRFDAVMAELRASGVRVNREDASSQDVTEEYVDIEARLRNLQATEAEYLELLKKAEDVQDIISVQQQLTDVRGQIEQLQGRKQYLERSAAMSAIEVSLGPPSAIGGIDLLRHVRPAWEASWDAVALLLGLIVFLWWLVPLIGGLILFLRWLGRRRRRAAATATSASPPPEPPAT